MTTSETLNTAADLIERKGWGQGAETWFNKTGSGLCVEGAIAAALGRPMVEGPDAMSPDELNFECPAGLAVREFLGGERLGMDPDTWLCNWNDRPATTASDVIEVLRATALIEAAKENTEAKVTVAA